MNISNELIEDLAKKLYISDEFYHNLYASIPENFLKEQGVQDNGDYPFELAVAFTKWLIEVGFEEVFGELGHGCKKAKWWMMDVADEVAPEVVPSKLRDDLYDFMTKSPDYYDKYLDMARGMGFGGMYLGHGMSDEEVMDAIADNIINYIDEQHTFAEIFEHLCCAKTIKHWLCKLIDEGLKSGNVCVRKKSDAEDDDNGDSDDEYRYDDDNCDCDDYDNYDCDDYDNYDCDDYDEDEEDEYNRY